MVDWFKGTDAAKNNESRPQGNLGQQLGYDYQKNRDAMERQERERKERETAEQQQRRNNGSWW